MMSSRLRAWGDVVSRAFGRGVFPPQLWFLLEIPGRRFILSPPRLADRLALSPDARVLEIGPGSGYFSAEVSRRVPRGHLVTLDLQMEMLHRVRARLGRGGPARLGFVQGDACRLPFAPRAFEVVFLVAVLGEVPDARACVRSCADVLAPGGLLSVTEQPGDPDFLPLATVRALVEGAGFTFVEQFGSGRNYTANFRCD